MLSLHLETGFLFSEKFGLIKTLKCPLEKQWEALHKTDPDEHRYTDTLTKNTTDLKRYCDGCQKSVFNINNMNEGQIEGVCLADPDICIYAKLPHPDIKPLGEDTSQKRCPDIHRDLRAIRTARHIEAINEAANNGFWPLIKAVNRNDELSKKIIVVQNKNGTIETSGDYRTHIAARNSKEYRYNNYTSPYPFAAYLIPPDIKPNERVYVLDIIEDTKAGGWQFDSWRLTDGYAVWDGEDLIIEDHPVKEWVG